MKKILCSLMLLGAALTTFAQGGYQDGIDYYNADRFDKAAIILNRTLNEPGTDKALAYYYLGCIDLRNGDVAGAKAKFEKGLAANDQCGYNYVGLGEIALKSGNKREAEDLFGKAMKINKKDADMATAIARAYFNVDATTYSREIDKYIMMALRNSRNKAPSVYVLQGDMAAAEGNIGAAAGYYEQAIVYEEEGGNVNPEAYVKYANVYNPINHDYAIAKLVELKSKLPTSALAQSELAEKYYDAEQYGKAAAEYREYMNNPNHFQQDEQRYSQLLFFDNKNQESLDLAMNVLAQDPTNYYMYRMVMLNNAALEKWEAAEQYAAKLFGARGAELTTMDYNTYANILQQLGKNDEAIAIYEKGYAANPEKNADMLASIANVYLDARDYGKAVEYLQKFVDTGKGKLSDTYDLATYYGAYASSLPEGSAERVAAANAGIKVIDDNIDRASEGSRGPFYLTRARLLGARDGSEPTADMIQSYENMMAAYGNNPSARPDAFKTAYVYQILYYKDSDRDKARAAFESLQALDPAFPNIDALGAMVR